MADQKISDLTNLAAAPADTDELYLLDGGTADKAIEVQYLQRYLSSGKLNNFLWFVYNNAGTLEHLFCPIGENSTTGSPGNPAATLVSQINNAAASGTRANLVDGTDSSTAMVGGAKIRSAGKHVVIFDTDDQATNWTNGNSMVLGAHQVYNTTGSGIFPRPTFLSEDVNGTTHRRLVVSFYTSDGVNFTIDTTNIASGKQIAIQISLYLL